MARCLLFTSALCSIVDNGLSVISNSLYLYLHKRSYLLISYQLLALLRETGGMCSGVNNASVTGAGAERYFCWAGGENRRGLCWTNGPR